MHQIEPFYGWLGMYNHEGDEHSPFHGVAHNQFYYDRRVYNYLAHPLWDSIGSESLLVKILYADYQNGYAVIELFGVWNDLLENDFKLLVENCLSYLTDAGVERIILICENVLNIYVEEEDYYEAFQEGLEAGWLCLLKPREHVLEELRMYGIDAYFFWSPVLDALSWRKLKPLELIKRVEQRMGKLLS